MTDKTTEALKLAEEALESCNSGKWGMSFDEIDVERALAAIREALAEQALQNLSDFHQHMEATEPKCSEHPDAPHGFDRNASHSAGRYVCECEGWEPVKQEPVACQFPRQPNNEGGWTIDAKFLNILVKDMADDEFAVGMEETEAVLLALERSYAEPVQPVKQEPVHEALQIASVALQDIACSSQTENLYWWQLRARKAQKQIAERLINAAPVQQAEQEPLMDYERINALREGEQNGAEDAYFFVRPENDTPSLRKMFCQGFERGFHKGLKYASHVRTKDLTDDEIARWFGAATEGSLIEFARAVIAADREKNRG